MEDTMQDHTDPGPQTSSTLNIAEHQSKRSKSSDEAALIRPPLERGSHLVSSNTHLISEAKKIEDSPIPQDLSKHNPYISRDLSSESSGRLDMHFVVLDDDDDEDDIYDDVGDELMQSDTIDSPAEASEIAAGSENRSPGFLKCSMCDQAFSSQQRLLLHINKHMGAKPYACPQCPANFNSRASFQRHRRSHKNSLADVQVHTCTLCHAQFSDVQHLTEHLKIHTEKRRSCPHCGIFIGGSRSMQKHITSEHPAMVKTYKKYRHPNMTARMAIAETNTDQLSSNLHEGDKTVSCRRCGRQFQTNRALQGHMKGHSRLYQWNPRRCKCGVLLADEAEYQRHLKNSCCTPISSLDLISPSGDSPNIRSSVQQKSAANLSLSAQRQGNARSKSLDSLRTPSTPFTYINKQSSSMEGNLLEFPPSAVSKSVTLTYPTDIHQYEGSKTSKEMPRNQNNVVNRSESPVNIIAIKAEDEEQWSEAVNLVQIHSNTVTSEEPSNDRENLLEQNAPFTSTRGEQTTDQTAQGKVSSPSSSNSNMPLGRPKKKSTESFVSARYTVLHGDVTGGPEPVPSIERITNESPNLQISSSQPSIPTPNTLINPSLLGEREEEGLPWRCSFCGITFEDSLMYVIHKGCHEPGSRFRCSMCGEQCVDKVTFMLHFVRGQHTTPTHI